MFQIFTDAVQNNGTEYLRFKNLRESGLFIEPQSHQISEDIEIKNNIEIPKARCAQIIPLEKVLKSFLESGDVLDEIIEYISSLNSDAEIMSNIMQGNLWKDIMKEYQGKIYLPYSLFFDDYETVNALGSHSGIQKLGAAYIYLKCIPPEHKRNLNNIFVAMLLHTIDHKTFGNRVSFSKLIEKLNYLAEKRIPVETSYGVSGR